MAYEVFRISKVHTAGISNLQQHNQQNEKHVDFLASRNENFNKEHLDLNRHLIHSEGFRADINEALKQYSIKKPRKDAVKMLDAIVTYSPEMTKHLCCYFNKNNKHWLEDKEHKKWMEEYNSIPQEDLKGLIEEEKAWADAYFDKALKWYEENFGYVISAEVHYTESTPHLHINSIPLKLDAEKGCYKLSAKEVVGNSQKLSSMQTKFHKEVGELFGLERGIERKEGEDIKRRKSKLQWEIEQAEKEAQEAEQRSQERAQLANEQASKAETEADKRAQKAEIEAKERAKKAQEQAYIFQEGAERRLNEMQAIDAQLESKKGELAKIDGSIKAQELANIESKKPYKKAPFHEDSYIVPGDVIIAYENLGNSQRKLNQQKKEFEEKEKAMAKREKRCASLERAYDSIPEERRELEKEKARFEELVEKRVTERTKEFKEKVIKVLEKMGIRAQFMKLFKALEKEINERYEENYYEKY